MLVLAPAQQLHIQDKLEAFSTYDLEIGVKELSLKWYGTLETAASSPEMHVVSSRPRLPAPQPFRAESAALLGCGHGRLGRGRGGPSGE